MRYSVYAKTIDGKILQGKTDADTAHDALGKLHASAKSNGHVIVKVTVKQLSDEVASDFKVIDRKIKAPAATSAPAAAAKNARKR